MRLRLTLDELDGLEPMDRNCAKHISVVNDIFSWEKELHKSQASGEEGSILCSSVKIIADECGVQANASKRILWAMCREWEIVHLNLVESKKESGQHVVDYCRCLGYQMSGNEFWSQATKRYRSSDM